MRTILLTTLIALILCGCRIETRWNSSNTTETVELPGGGLQVATPLPDGRKRITIYDKEGKIQNQKDTDVVFEASPQKPAGGIVYAGTAKTETAKTADVTRVEKTRRDDTDIIVTGRSCRMTNGDNGREVRRGWSGAIGCQRL
ncbi:MAG: hypothetical protein WA021_00655 [Minisyncoccia bacterium]